MALNNELNFTGIALKTYESKKGKMMGFTADYIKTLGNVEEISTAKYFNSLRISAQKQTNSDEESSKSLKRLKKIIANKKIAPLLENINFKNISYSTVFNNPYALSNSEMDELITQLEALHSPHLKNLIAELKIFKAHNLEETKAKYQPRGLYGCLSSIENLLSMSNVPASIPLQNALLAGVVIPTLSLFEDLEVNGDLTIESIPKLMTAKAKVLEAWTLFSTTHEADLKKELEQFDKENKQLVENKLKPSNDKLSALGSSYSALYQLFTSEVGSLTAQQKSQLEDDMAKITKEIASLNNEIKEIEQSLNKTIDKKRNNWINERKKEANALGMLFDGLNKELDSMHANIQALYEKKKIDEKYPKTSSEYQLKQRKKAIKELQEKTNLHFLLSDDSSIEQKKFIEKYGGKLLLNQSQSRLAAMGHSDGLCGGYSAQFLEVCSSDSWENLSFKDKMRRFKPILATKETIRLDASSNVLRNELWMTLESGLRWDIQRKHEVTKNADIFKIEKGDRTHAIYKSENENAKAFYEKYVSNLMEKVKSSESARLMLWLHSAEEGHALALNYDKDGFLFHDSNTGYIRFEDADKFATFMVDYLFKNYPDLTNNGTIYDFDILRKNLSHSNLKVKREQSRAPSSIANDLASSRMKKHETTLLDRIDSVKSQIESNNQLLRKASAKTTIQDTTRPAAETTPDKSSHTPPAVITQGTLKETPVIPEQTPNLRRAKAKRVRAVTFRETSTTARESKVQDIQKKEAVHALVTEYLNKHDETLNDKAVLKQRLFHEILSELVHKTTSPDLDNLRKMCQQHKLEKCSQMLDEVSRIYAISESARRTRPAS